MGAESIFVPLRDICASLVWDELFPHKNPIHIDLGAGDGGFAIAFAQQNPEINLLSVERLLGRLRKIVKKGNRLGLKNLRVIRCESAYLMKYLVFPNSVDVIHVMHPDPWPKRKQQKNRLFQTEFIDSCAKALKEGGELRLTLDHPGYFKEILERMSENETFKSIVWRPNVDYPRSDFEKQFVQEGKVVIRQAWEKTVKN